MDSSAKKPKTIMSASKDSQAKHPSARISGSSFFPEMRAICNLMDLSGRNYQTEAFNILSAQGQKTYKQLNLSMSMPLVKIQD